MKKKPGKPEEVILPEGEEREAAHYIFTVHVLPNLYDLRRVLQLINKP